MLKKLKNKSGFTLVEMIVAITILSIILVSVMSIFVIASDIANKIDINRAMQENVKNIVEEIAEDIRLNGINICNEGGVDCYNFTAEGSDYIKSDILYIGSNTYYIAKLSSLGAWIKVNDYEGECYEMSAECRFVKNGSMPLSNSLVNIMNLNFYISQKDIPKVTLNMKMRPSGGKGVKSELIHDNVMVLQTTLTERIIKNK